MNRINISTARSKSASTLSIPKGQRLIGFYGTEQGDLILEVDPEDYYDFVDMLTSQLSWQEKRELAQELEEEAMEEECDKQELEEEMEDDY